MNRRSNALFYEGDLAATLTAHENDALSKISQFPEYKIRERDQSELVQELLDEHIVQPILLRVDEVKKSVVEVDVDVSRDSNRNIRDRSRPFSVKGFEYSCGYPYTGDSLLWRLKPSSWSSVLPYGEVVSDAGGRNGVLTLKAVMAGEAKPEELTAAIERELKIVQQYVGWQLGQIEQFNTALEGKIRGAIERRASQVRSVADLAAALGASMMVQPTLSESARRLPPTSKEAGAKLSPENAKKHDLFISHASEDKDVFVRPLAAALRERNVDVWIDETELKLGDSLRRTIDRGLAGSKYGVVVLSPSFFSKSWPQYELDGLVAREVGGQKVILPIWLGVSREDVVGFSPTLADRLAANASKKSIDEIADQVVSVLRG